MDTLSFIFQGLIPVFIFFTVIYGFAKGVPVYDSFVSGAKDGIGIIMGIFPYVLAIFIAIKTFEASAVTGMGVFETLREISKQTVRYVTNKHLLHETK